MPTSEECYDRARESLRNADLASDEGMRTAFIRLARTWMQAGLACAEMEAPEQRRSETPTSGSRSGGRR